MYNLQKTIRYGFWLIFEVIALCVGMIYSTRTVRAEPEVQQPARKVTEVVTEKWTVISGKRLDLILKYMGDINFEKEGISLRIPASVAQSWKVDVSQRRSGNYGNYGFPRKKTKDILG